MRLLAASASRLLAVWGTAHNGRQFMISLTLLRGWSIGFSMLHTALIPWSEHFESESYYKMDNLNESKQLNLLNAFERN